MRTVVIASLAAAAINASFLAYGRTAPEQAFSGKIRWGQCRLESGKQADSSPPPPAQGNWPLACVHPKVSAQMLMRDDSGKENLALFYGSFYHGVFLSKRFSIHGDYEGQRLSYLGARSSRGPAVVNNHRTKELFAQIGNPSEDRWRFSAGKIDSAFGINYHPLPEIVDALLRSTRYWSAPNFGARLTYDTQVSSVFDVSAHSNALEYKRKGIDLNDSQPAQTAIAARAMFDIAALDGFRFVTSAYGSDDGERRVGGGIVNMSARGDYTTFEWVRLSGAVNVTKSNYQQNFRLNFTSAFRNDLRWVFDFESERKGYRMGTIGLDTKLPDYGLLRLSGSLHNGWERKTDHYFMVMTALEVAL